jgi:hypothetical protein
MAYTLGTSHARTGKTSQLIIIDTKSVFTGFRAFAKTEATGCYQEVFDLAQESLWVSGVNEGSWHEGPFETKTEAVASASKAYRHLNRSRKEAA